MTNLSEIMRRAHAIGRERRGEISWAGALRMSWAIARGFAYGFETSYLDNGKLVRITGFSGSYDETHAACIKAKNALVARGFKPTGSAEFSLRKYLPKAEAIQTINVPAPAEVRKAA